MNINIIESDEIKNKKCKKCLHKNKNGIFPISCRKCNPLIKKPKIEKEIFDINTHKKCPRCKEIKELINFKKSKTIGYNCNCHPCHKIIRREYKQRPNVKERERKIFIKGYLRRAYGITYEQYQYMFLKQNGKCAICKKETEFNDYRSSKRINLGVDHCHETGKVRGLLCVHCNFGIGAFKDDIKLMSKAIKYIKSNK